MVILGIHGLTHDSTAALSVEGRLSAFFQEERLSRIKGDGGFPRLSIRACLDFAGLLPREIDCVVLPFRPWIGAGQRLAYQFRHPINGIGSAARLIARGRGNLGIRRELTDLGIRAQLIRSDHHEAHARAVFLSSPFEEAVILVVDGVAEAWSGAAFRAQRFPKPRFECMQRFRFPASLGLVYAAVTEHLGFKHNREEGKVMAMAALGDESLFEAFQRVCRVDQGSIILEHSLFDFGGTWTRPEFSSIFGRRRQRDEDFLPRHFALARALQKNIEECCNKLALRLLESTRCENLCFTGGLALNPSLNAALTKAVAPRRCFFLPAGGDAGTALGAALSIDPDPRWRLKHPYWGNETTEAEVKGEIRRHRLRVRAEGHDAIRRCAEFLSEGAIGGIFHGRSEMGPRALGHRSILADVSRPEIRDRLNQQIKKREDFQPFGPCLLSEVAEEYFPGLGESPFMLRTIAAADAGKHVIPAVIHADGTSRPQTVSEGDDSGLAPLLREYSQAGRPPILINTSLNLKGMPLAESPADAIVVFLQGPLDFLLLEGRLMERKNDGN